MKRFTLHDRVPCGLPQIMKELATQGSLATREQIMNGSLYGKNEKSEKTPDGGKRAFISGMARAVASGIYKNTFGYVFGGGSTTQEQ